MTELDNPLEFDGELEIDEGNDQEVAVELPPETIAELEEAES